MRVACFIFLYFIAQAGASQSPLGANQSKQSRAFQLFNNGEYESVLQVIGDTPATLDDQYLILMSKVNLATSAPGPLEVLVKENPKYYLNTYANFTIGRNHFYNKKIREAERSLKAIDGSALSEQSRGDYYFMRGYLSMRDKQYKVSQNYFQRSRKIATENGSELTYYQGFVAYHLNQKERAKKYLSEVAEEPQFGTSAKFFLSKIYLEEQEYEKVIELAQSELSDEKTITNSAFNQLVGEAYALQDQASKASNYFEKALELHPGQPSAALYYQAGVANFKISLREKAIKYLTEAGVRSGDYAQLSAFQLGRLYVSANDKDKAASAYIEASASSDEQIKEESVLMAGKLLLDLKNYSEGIKYLEDYRTDFTDGKWKKDAEDLLAEAYLRTSNYDQAINHLREIGLVSKSNKVIYQTVTFQKAFLLFNDGNFTEAISWFDESLKYPENQSLRDEAYYNQAEAYFSLSQFEKASQAYQKQSNIQAESLYGLGYAYFNLFQYGQSIDYFERFLQSNPSPALRDDARLRLADAYYATKEYEKSLTLYKRLSQRNRSTYLSYQIGIVNRNLDNKEDAVSSFEEVLQMGPDTLTDDAISQIAQLRFESAKFEEAEFHFSSLIAKFPSSSLTPESYLNRAISRSNLNKYESAKSDYEFIIKNYLKSKGAFNAILGLQELQGKGVEVKNIQEYIADYRKANPDDESLEVVEFEYAKSQYFNLKYNESAQAFQKFVKDYSSSSYLLEAKYYLADSYYRNDRLEESKLNFAEIAGIRNQFSGRVYSRLGDIKFRLESFDEAITSYKSLVELSLSPKDSYKGQAGLMKSYFQVGDYEACISTADAIIAADWQPLNGERNALLLKGKSLLELGSLEQSEIVLGSLSDQTDRISAEASFLIARMKFDKGEHQASLDLLFAFNSKFGSYQNLIDQSYLQIANNYIQMDELFQAKATLRSIIQHSENEDVKQLALNKLNLIELQQPEDSTINKQ